MLQYKNAVWGNKKSFGLGVAPASHQHVVQFTEHFFKGLDPGQKLDVLILFGLEVGFQHLDGLFRGMAVLLLIREGWQVRRKTCSGSFRVFEHRRDGDSVARLQVGQDGVSEMVRGYCREVSLILSMKAES